LTISAISKDGSKIAYVANDGLYLKNTHELTERLIQTADDSPKNPFFSPDGQWIGYFSSADRQVKKIDITTDTPMKICDAGSHYGASWGADDMIVFADASTGIMRVSANGGTPEEIVKAGETEILSSPQVLPDGKSILFTAETEDGPQVVVQSLESEKRKNLFLGTAAQYLPTGHLVYALDNNLFAIAFDPDRLETIGGAVTMDEGIFQTGTFLTQSAISNSGTLIYVPGTAQPETSLPKYTLVWVDRQGKVEEIDADSDTYSQPKISPDGKKVAVIVSTEEGSSDICILDLNSGNMDRRTFNGTSTDPLWTPDSQRIIFIAGEGDEMGIYRKAANGTGKEDLLALVSDGGDPPWSLADNGKTLVTTKRPSGQGFSGTGMGRIQSSIMMRRMMAGSGGPAPKRAVGSEESSTGEETEDSTDIGSLSMEGEHEWEQLLSIEGLVGALQISPDHRWIAYGSLASEGLGVFVRPFPDMESGGPWQVSTDDAIGCFWSPNGRELFYFNMEDGSLMAVEVETEPTFKKVKTNSLFKTTDIGLDTRAMVQGHYDISPDGNRFLMLKNVETAEEESRAEETTASEPNKIIIVTNWFEELKKRVPVD
jgi:Tol biopolymer transport system component